MHPNWIEECALWENSYAPPMRSIQEFAEGEIVLPDTGPHRNKKFRCEYQPYTHLWFDGIHRGGFNVYAATGPSQSGKTLCVCVIPTMYHLFEVRETVIFFSPSMEINEDKWLVDIRPTIERSRFGEFLPKGGRGSQGGFSELMTFGNGVRLKFMTGGGGDKNKAAFTARVGVGTEIDGMDKASETSRETDPISQIHARFRSHGTRWVAYHDCTVSTPEGRIWQEVTNGTNSRIVLECPHCFHWVTPGRENFIGWADAETEVQAERLGKFYCPDCGTGWSPEQRIAAILTCRLVHRGQEVTPTGEIVGAMPETRTFGLRWSAVDNMFTTEAQIGSEEWKAARNPDRDAAEKERCQFVWCLPFRPEKDATELTEELIASRLTKIPQYICPDDTETLVAQVDMHIRWHYYTVMATGPNGERSIIDYGLNMNPDPKANGPKEAMRIGLEQLAYDLDEREWKTVSGDEVPFDIRLIDAGYEQDIGLAFVTENPGWRLVKGQGKDFKLPPKATPDQRPGNHWYDSRQPKAESSDNKKWWLAQSDMSYWMRQVHSGFTCETFNQDGTRRPGSIALFGEDPAVHLSIMDKTVARSAYATQLLGWKWGEVKLQKGGVILDWIFNWKEDHWFDTTYGCLVADAIVRKYEKRFRVQAAASPTDLTDDGEVRFTTPDGRNYLITER